METVSTIENDLWQEQELFATPASITNKGKLDLEKYKATLEKSGCLNAFRQEPHDWTAKDLSLAIFNAVEEALPAEAGWIINSSTGKDSTLMTAIFAEHLLLRQKQGMSVRPATIYIADTGSEFPEMAHRMQEECEAINKWAQKKDLPLKCVLVRPPPKNRLLVELIGNGKPLPKLTSAKGAMSAASWCMSRVKATPIEKAQRMAKETYSSFAQCIGVRKDESARRAGHINNYSAGLPYGLARMGDSPNMGVTPIVHWDATMLAEALAEWGTPWRYDGVEELKRIYAKGSDPGLSPRECPIRITADGGVSTTCSDLGGGRLGCWMCLLSTNRSLKNTADKDRRYEWLRKVHRWLYLQHQRNFARVKLRDKAGFTKMTLFPRSYNFNSRYWLLMLVMRAELESGFELLPEEDLKMIETFWRRHGVRTVTTKDARADTLEWKQTGKVNFRWRCHAYDENAMGRMLSEGIPNGAFFHLEQKKLKAGKDDPRMPLELVHLLALAGEQFTTPISPSMMAYVFADRANENRTIVMVTDTPSILGSRMNTGLINGLHGASWRLLGMRLPTQWEYRICTGTPYTHNAPNSRIDCPTRCGSRSIFYSTTNEEEQKRRDNKKLTKTERIDCEIRVAENEMTTFQGCPAEPLTEHIMEGMDIHQMHGKLNWTQLKALLEKTAVAAGRADWLTDQCHIAANQIRRLVLDTIPKTHEPGRAGQRAKQYIRNIAQEITQLDDLLPHMLKWRDAILEICHEIRAGRANAALIAKLAYVVRMYPVDPDEGDRLVLELSRQLNIKLPETTPSQN